MFNCTNVLYNMALFWQNKTIVKVRMNTLETAKRTATILKQLSVLNCFFVASIRLPAFHQAKSS